MKSSKTTVLCIDTHKENLFYKDDVYFKQVINQMKKHGYVLCLLDSARHYYPSLHDNPYV